MIKIKDLIDGFGKTSIKEPKIKRIRDTPQGSECLSSIKDAIKKC